MSKLALWFGTGLGVGFIRYAPGTFGTLWGLPLAYAILHLPHPIWQLLVATSLCLIGVPVCGMAATELQMKDPGPVVWDEFTALPIVFLGLTPTAFSRPWIPCLGFALFRLFDISKFPPGRQFERLPHGWGIMCDDIAAACYGWLTLWLLLKFFPTLNA